MEQKEQRRLTEQNIQAYLIYLREQEKSVATIQKYAHDLSVLCEYLNGAELTKCRLIDWKERLTQRYAAASINTMLAALNSFLEFSAWSELKVKPLKVQRSLFCDENSELTQAEYTLVLQTICATGIRVSELQFITVEALRLGRAESSNKGKRRVVFLPDRLRRLLNRYLHGQKRTAGPVFVTKTGNPLDRSNIWRDMKALCAGAGVAPGKVFPHNLRHLFARTYYSLEKVLSRLADILGHSNVNTTKIYTGESGSAHARQVERLGLIIT